MRILAAILLTAVVLALSIVASLWMLAALVAGSPRGWRLALAFDQLANAMTGGDEDETISSRAWRNRHRQPWATLRRIIDAGAAMLDDHNHCQKSAESEALKREQQRGRFWGL